MKHSVLPIVARGGMILMGLALIGLALSTFFSPYSSSISYGVPAQAVGFSWVQATGLRDGVLGLYTLYLSRSMRNTIPFLGCMLLLPLGDVIIVLLAQQGWIAALPHLVGTVAIGILLSLCFAVKPNPSL